jgi:hypothetical protein
MEIENGAFAKKEVFFVSGSGFPAEADVGARRLNLNRVGRSRGHTRFLSKLFIFWLLSPSSSQSSRGLLSSKPLD